MVIGIGDDNGKEGMHANRRVDDMMSSYYIS